MVGKIKLKDWKDAPPCAGKSSCHRGNEPNEPTHGCCGVERGKEPLPRTKVCELV
jgi:hypothetical protein